MPFLSVLLCAVIAVQGSLAQDIGSWLVTTEVADTTIGDDWRTTITNTLQKESIFKTTLSVPSSEVSYQENDQEALIASKLKVNEDNTENPNETENQVHEEDCFSKCDTVVDTLYIKSDIKFRYATTIVHSKVTNPSNTSQEATFRITLPNTAFISRFFIEKKGKHYEAFVREKGEAERAYQKASEQGQTAAQVAQSNNDSSIRDSDIFEITLNVAARSSVSFNLTYEELLSRHLSVYRHVITISPGQEVRELNVDVYIREIRNITYVNATTLNSETSTSKDDDVTVEQWSPVSAYVRLFSGDSKRTQFQDGNSQQLVVEYDVDRTVGPPGEIMIMDGYFVHFFSADDVPVQPKHVIFVLDTSGSMWGRKLQQMQQAMCSILDRLRKEDYFNIIHFGTNVKDWSSEPQEVVGLNRYNYTYEVNDDNIYKAKEFIKSLEASGGTNINGALRKALQLAAKQKYGTGNPEKKKSKLKNTREPIIIFLSDGLPTVGELLTSKILANTRAVNTEIRAPIFSLSFGDGGNYRLLKKLSLQNHGFARKIYEASDTSVQIQSFYEEIASPLLANVSFSYLDFEVDDKSLTKTSFHSFYAGSEIIVAGKINTDTEIREDILKADVKAWNSVEHKEIHYKQHEVKLLKGEKKGSKRQSRGGSLERLWAYLTVQQLLDKYYAAVDDKEELRISEVMKPNTPAFDESDPRKRALELALRFSFVTPLTSLVVVLPPTGSRNKATHIVNNPTVNSIFDSSPSLETLMFQNKIVPLDGIMYRPPILTARPPLPTSSRPTFMTTEAVTATTTEAVTTSMVNDEAFTTIVPSATNFTLEDIAWLRNYLDSSGKLMILTNDSSAENSSFQIKDESLINDMVLQEPDTCITPRGEIGSCQPLSLCVQSEFLEDYDIFLEYFCPIGRLAGVCCPNFTIEDFNQTVTTTTEQALEI